MDQTSSDKGFRIILKTADTTNVILLNSKNDLDKNMKRSNKNSETEQTKPKRRRRTKSEMDRDFRLEFTKKQQQELEKLENQSTRSKETEEISTSNEVEVTMQYLADKVADLTNIVLSQKKDNVPQIYLVSTDQKSESKIRRTLENSKTDYKTIMLDPVEDRPRKIEIKEVRKFDYLSIMDVKPPEEESDDLQPKMMRKFIPPGSKRRRGGAATKTAPTETIETKEIETNSTSNVSIEEIDVVPENTPEIQPAIVNIEQREVPTREAHPQVQKNSKFYQINAWLARRQSSRCVKQTSVLTKMLVKSSLIATFKCMSRSCSYTTTDGENFKAHLDYHGSIQLFDEFLYFCPYCFFKGISTSDLIDHYQTFHINDKYQCGYCFYRAADSQSCWEHVRKFHAQEPSLIFDTPLKKAVCEASDQRLQRKRKGIFPLPCSS